MSTITRLGKRVSQPTHTQSARRKKTGHETRNCSATGESAYLESERASQLRHEYVAGEVFALTGGSKAHNTISLSIAVLLRNALRGSGCQTFIADMKVRITTQASYYYPDAAVTCAPDDLVRKKVKIPLFLCTLIGFRNIADARMQVGTGDQ